jgi:two-component system sensor histidine kinase/response regulator
MAQRQIYLEHGFDECLLKPVSLGQFRRLLIRWGLLGEDGKNNVIDLDDTEPLENNPQLSSQTLGGQTLDPSALPETFSSIDKKAITEQMGAFDQNAIEMLKMFIDMTAPLISRIHKAAENDDIHDLHEAAHSLKGAARSACLNRLGEIAAKIQTRAERSESCDDLMPQLEEEFANAREEIQAL